MHLHKTIILNICVLFAIMANAQNNTGEKPEKPANRSKYERETNSGTLELKKIEQPVKKADYSKVKVQAKAIGEFKKIGDEKVLTLKEAILEQRKSLAPENIKQLNWIPNTSSYSYIKKDADNPTLISVSATGDEKVMLTLKDLNVEIKRQGWDKLKKFPVIHWIDASKFYFKSNSNYVEYEFEKGLNKVLSYSEKSANHDYLPKENLLAFTDSSGLLVKDSEGIMTVASSSSEGVIYGQAVHRFEFGIRKGTFWSPQANYLAFYKKDESMVTDYPLMHLNTKPANAEMIHYPMAGNKSHEVEVGIFNRSKGEVVYVQFDHEEDFYKTNISWSHDEKSLFIAMINRGQDHVRLNEYDTKTGKFVRTILEERSDKYVEPEHPLLHVKDDTYLWRSERDDYEQFYLIKNGKLVKKLLKENVHVREVLGFTKDKKYVVFEGVAEDAINQYIYKMSLSNGKLIKLTKEEGWHKGKFNSENNVLIDHFSSVELPRVIKTLDFRGKELKTILKAKNPLEMKNMSKPEISTIENDGVKLYTRMIKPSHFDASKKYPVLVYVYGGPHAQLIKNNWLADAPMWMYWMAEQGYIVYTVDGRGSFNRNLAFEQATFRQLGTVEMKDQLAGVDYLRTLPYVDVDRMAVHGWSFGGFMTTSLMLRYPGIFKVGVAGGPVIDWDMYEIMYTERYMDTPKENPEGYKKASLFQYVPNLEGKLLMIHGVIDDVVLLQHSLAFVKECVDKEVQMDYFVYPGHPHNVRGKDRVHLMRKVLTYVMDNL